MTINFLNPLLNISKGIGIGHVVHDNNPVGASIVGGGNPESWGRESNTVRVCANNTGTAGQGFGPWIDGEQYEIKILTFEIALARLYPRFAI